MTELDQLRNEIDCIDRQLLALFEARMQVSRGVARYKKAHDMQIFVPEREKAVLEDRVSRLEDKALSEAAAEFFRHLMELSRGEQQKVLAQTED